MIEKITKLSNNEYRITIKGSKYLYMKLVYRSPNYKLLLLKDGRSKFHTNFSLDHISTWKLSSISLIEKGIRQWFNEVL